MSTLLVFSSKRGLRSRDDKRKPATRRCVAELDTILAMEAKAKAELDDALESESRRTPTSVSSFPFQEQKADQNRCGATFRQASSRAFCSKGADDDCKSLSSNTIPSRDITECSEYLIANMQQMKKYSQAFLGETVMSSPTQSSRRSKSRSSARRNRRGDSLEREISRTILQRTKDSNEYFPGSSFKSAQEILNDLTSTLAPFLWDSPVTPARSSPEEPYNDEARLENRPLPDGGDEQIVLSGDQEDRFTGEKLDVDDTIVLASSSSYSVDLPFISSDETPVSYRSGSCEGTHGNLIEAETLVVELESSTCIAGKETSASEINEIKQIYADGVVDFAAEPVAEESKCNLVESLTSNTFILVAPLMKGHPITPQQDKSHESIHSPYQSKFLQRQVQAVPKEPPSPFHSTEQAPKTIDAFGGEWIPFEDESVFANSFSPEKDGFSQVSSITVSPESPTSVLSFVKEGDLALTPLPEEGFIHRPEFPEVVSSHSGLDEVSHRFQI
ncbi:hypothetical protein MHU86_7653 [Fragilaria crotonensis]|nr:hypothetical protein MHU86_7653 [Fragilaria crotonensis]